MIRFALVAAALVACNKATPPPAANAPADCDKVAEIVTNFELGPGATPEGRVAAVSQHRDACKSVGLTVTEANCIAKAKGTWDLMACAPKMFPQRAAVGDCKAVATKMRSAMLAEMPKEVGDGGIAMVDRMVGVMETSCGQDNWPVEFRQCILAAKPEELTGPSRKCEDMLPQEMQLKMGQRLKPIASPGDHPPTPSP